MEDFYGGNGLKDVGVGLRRLVCSEVRSEKNRVV
jgi:hypothetical protein